MCWRVFILTCVAVLARTGALQDQHCKKELIDINGCQTFTLESPRHPNQKCLITSTSSAEVSFHFKPGQSFSLLEFIASRDTETLLPVPVPTTRNKSIITFGHHELSDQEKWYEIELKETINYVSNTYKAYIDGKEMASTDLYLLKGQRVYVYIDGSLSTYAPGCNPTHYMSAAAAASPSVSTIMLWCVMVAFLLIMLVLTLLAARKYYRIRQLRKEGDRRQLVQAAISPEAPQQQQQTAFTNHHHQDRFMKPRGPSPLPQRLPDRAPNTPLESNHIYEEVDPVIYQVRTGEGSDQVYFHYRENSLYVPSDAFVSPPSATGSRRGAEQQQQQAVEQSSSNHSSVMRDGARQPNLPSASH